jgi:DNA-binding transcriptional ArsR family regulator
VAELAAEMPISRPAVSQHLKVLKDAGVVHDVQQGRHRIYSLDGERLDRYRRQLDGFWSDALSGLAESPHKSEREAG